MYINTLHTHYTHTLSLSLSHTHTHTNDIPLLVTFSKSMRCSNNTKTSFFIGDRYCREEHAHTYTHTRIHISKFIHMYA